MSTIEEQIQSMTTGEVLEAAEMILPELIDIASPEELGTRIAQLANLTLDELSEVESLARKAATSAPHEITNALRLVLSDAVAELGQDNAALTLKLASVGQKQIISGAEMYGFGVLLIAAYIALKGQGKKSEKSTITIEESKDGKKKITMGRETIYLNPLNPLADLIKRIYRGE